MMKKIVAVVFLIALLALAVPAAASSPSPFVGHWQTIDIDGSDIRLTIAGRGPYRVTWTESFFSFCNREAGIVRGTGEISEGNSNVLEADLHIECFTFENSLDFQTSWTYNPFTDTMSSPDGLGGELTWNRPGR